MKPAALLLVLLLAACNKGQPKPVCFVTHSNALETFPLELAQDLGHFRDEGVDVTIEHTNKLTEAVVAGSCDIAYDAFPSTLQAVAAEQNLKVFSVVNIRSTMTFVVSAKKASQVRRIEDLKGALVGITAFGNATESMAKHALRQRGLQQTDVTLIPTGSGPATVAALEHGKVDAAFVPTRGLATLRQRAPGVSVLLDMRTPEGTREFYGVDAIPLYALSAKSDWLKQRPDDARRVTRAMRKTLQWIREHPIDEVYARMSPLYRSDFKEGDMEALRVFVSALSPDGRMPPGGAEAVQRVVSAADERVLKIDLASTWTNEFLEKAQ